MTLTDTGPLLALLDKRDFNHAACVAAARHLPPGPLLTTWPCMTEAIYLLGEIGGYRYQERLWQLRREGRLEILELDRGEVDRADALMFQYRNVPMDLADASLVAVAERRGFRRIFTVDQDFHIYVLADGSVLEIIP